MTDEQKAVRDFHQADFEHFAESFWRNEAIGESRLNIFLGLIASVYGAIGFIGKSNDRIDWTEIRPLAVAATAALFIVGVLTLLRVLKRNASTDDFIKAMGKLREVLAQGQVGYVAHLKTGRTLISGGTKQFVACVNAGLVGVFVWLTTENGVWCAGASVAAFLVQESLIRGLETHYDRKREQAGKLAGG